VGLFLPSGLGFFHGNDSTWMFWVPYRSTSMLEIVPKDDEEGYEDATQNATALRAEGDCIVTRNKKDFSNSSLPVYTPAELLDILNQ
jgi:hypothetical protein